MTDQATVDAVAHAIASRVGPERHGQLCPVWTRRHRGPVPLSECDCWVLSYARDDAQVAIDAVLPVLTAGHAAELDHVRAEEVQPLRQLLQEIKDRVGWFEPGDDDRAVKLRDDIWEMVTR